MGAYKTLVGKVVIGLTEKIAVQSPKGRKAAFAKIDTGATNSSLDIDLAKDLKLGPVIKSKYVKSAHGSMVRPVVMATITLAGKTITAEFTLADRKHLKYPVLVGQNILKHGFLIDPGQ